LKKSILEFFNPQSENCADRPAALFQHRRA
jgi:hypothetical protein